MGEDLTDGNLAPGGKSSDRKIAVDLAEVPSVLPLAVKHGTKVGGVIVLTVKVLGRVRLNGKGGAVKLRIRIIAFPRWNTLVALSCVLHGAAGTASAQTQHREPLSVSEVLGIAEFADRNQLDLSPDGALVAFALQDPRRVAEGGRTRAFFDDRGVPRGHRGTDVYVADVRTGETRRLSEGHGASWAPVWSPDGRYLAFYSDRDGLARVWLWERSRDTLVRLSDGIARPFFGFEQVQWSPDGRRMLVKLLPAGMTFADVDRLLPSDPAAPREPTVVDSGVTARVFAYAPAAPGTGEESRRPEIAIDLDSTRSFLNVELADLALIDVSSGRARRLARRVRVMGYRFAPVGDRVAFSTRQPNAGTGMLVYNRYDLWVVDTASGPPRLLSPRTVQDYGLCFSWSPSGELIAYASDSTVHVVRAADGAAARHFARDGVCFEEEYRAPLWLDDETIVVTARDTLWRLSVKAGGVAPAAAPRDRRVLEVLAPATAQQLTAPVLTVAVSELRSKRVGFQRLDLRTGAATPLFEGDLALGATALAYHLDASRDGRVVAFVAENSARPSDVWVSDAGFREPRRLTDLHPEVSRLALGHSQLVEWSGPGGRRLQGALLLPAGYEPGKRYPLVAKVYGGELLSGRVNRFGLESGIDNLQLLATRGYAVLLPDTPTDEGTPMADLAASVLPGLDSVIAMGVADPDRLAILGHSYGGYSALAIAVQSARFRAVVSSGGFSNLFSQYTEMREDGSVVGIGWSERGQGRMGGHPWEYRQRYLENSPFFFLDRITAPVLLLHGGSDGTVLRQRAEETFVGLRRLGKEVTLVIYEGEEHHPGSWSVENATDYWERIFDWLARHLASPAPRP